MASSADLIERWVYLDPFFPEPSEARLNEYGVHVWALVGYRRAVGGDHARVAADYDIPMEVLQAALAFYRRHRRAIDARIAANAA